MLLFRKSFYRMTVLVYFPEHCRLIIWCEQCYFCRDAGYTNIAQRLIEVQFELTDRLTYYLCGRRPGKCSFPLSFFFYNINTFNIIIIIIIITIIVAYMIIIINIFFYGEFGCLCIFSLFKFSLPWENLNQLIFVTRGNHWLRIWVHHLWKRNRVERGPVSRPKCLW